MRWRWIAIAGLCVGCGQSQVRPPYPPDPLLSARQPSELKPEKTPRVLVAMSEPAPPQLSEQALASAPFAVKENAPLALQPVPSRSEPVAQPVSRSRQSQ